MTQKIDMSPDAVTGRMIALDQLWELAVALRGSKIVEREPPHELSKERHDIPCKDIADAEKQ
jgi:hypothetical protein